MKYEGPENQIRLKSKINNKYLLAIFEQIEMPFRILKCQGNRIFVKVFYDRIISDKRKKIEEARFVFNVLKKSSELKLKLEWKGFKDNEKRTEFVLHGPMQKIRIQEKVLSGIYAEKKKDSEE